MLKGMQRWQNKVALVTGAASGIGAAVAERLVEEGLQVVGLDVDLQGVEALAKKLDQKSKSSNTKLHPIRADVTNEDDLGRALRWISDNVGPVHILINNAGLARSSTLLNGSTEHWRQTLEVNLLAVAVLSREVINMMKAHGIDDGHIININSVTGHMVPELLPKINIYSASKHGVTGLTKTLRLDLRNINSNIKVTSISPGAVNTKIMQDYSEEVRGIFEKLPKLEPVDLANAIAFVISTPPHVSIAELTIVSVGEKSV